VTELGRALAFLDATDERAVQRIEPFRYGTALVHERLNLVHDLNFLRLERGEPAAAVLADECEAIQGPAGMEHRSIAVRGADEKRLAPGFAALGWALDRAVVMAAQGEAEPRPKVAVEEVTGGELDPAWTEDIRGRDFARGRDDVVQQLVDLKRVVADAVPTRYFAARVEGAIASYCELYARDGVAQIESVLTVEPYRGRGLASAVVRRALDEARRAGAAFVFLQADRDDWPKELYRRLGFEEIGGYGRFVLRRAAS